MGFLLRSKVLKPGDTSEVERTAVIPLPEGILCMILREWEVRYHSNRFLTPEALEDPWRNDMFYTALTKLRLVSRQFKRVVDSLPYLWRRVSYKMPQRVRKRVWRRTRRGRAGVPLIVDADNSHARMDRRAAQELDLERLDFAQFVKQAVQSSWHWESLRIVTSDRKFDALAWRLLRRPAPNLQKLEVKMCSDSRYLGSDIKIFRNLAAPREISMSGISVPWTPELTSGAKFLDGQFTIAAGGPYQGAVLVDILLRENMANRLTRLTIQPFSSVDSERVQDWRIPSISLPCLRHLEVVGLSTMEIESLFSHIETPNAVVRVRAGIASGTTSIRWVASWFGRHVHNLTYGPQSVRLYVKRDASPSNTKVDLILTINDLWSRNAILVIGWLARKEDKVLTIRRCTDLCTNVLQRAPKEWIERVTRFSVIGPGSGTSLSTLLRHLDPHLPNLQELGIHEEILETIAPAITQTRPGLGADRLIFPHMEAIHISCKGKNHDERLANVKQMGPRLFQVRESIKRVHGHTSEFDDWYPVKTWKVSRKERLRRKLAKHAIDLLNRSAEKLRTGWGEIHKPDAPKPKEKEKGGL